MSGFNPDRVVKLTSVVETPGEEPVSYHGTGYFITRDLILTASHVLPKGGTPTIRFFRGKSPYSDASVRPVWSDEKLDAALLRVDPPLEEDAAMPELLTESPAGEARWRSAAYPYAGTDDGKWDRHGLEGPFYAQGGVGESGRFLDLGVNHSPQEGEDWSGASGAPVFVGDKLAGIIRSYPELFNGVRLAGVPIQDILAAAGPLEELPLAWMEPFPDAPWCLVLVSEARQQKKEELRKLVAAAIASRGTQASADDVPREMRVAVVTEALLNRKRWLSLVQAMCAAPVMIIDVTDSEPAVMLMLGIRSVVRRGVTITTTATRLDTEHLATLPFNIQETKLVSLERKNESGKFYTATDPNNPINRVGQAIIDGLDQLKSHPGYLDLPAYDAVRCPEPKPRIKERAPGSGQEDVQTVQDTILMLCPFRPEYDEKQRYISSEMYGAAYKAPVRMLDIVSPRLVGQALYEHIRWSRCCIVDWTHWRANVFFELGVRLACSGIGPVCLVEEEQARRDAADDDPLRQKELLRLLFDPIQYIFDPERFSNGGPPEPFERAWQRYQANAAGPGNRAPRATAAALEHDETYRNIESGSYDWRQEAITKAPHDELLASIELQLGKIYDIENKGEFPALFSRHPDFSRELQRSAAERGIAAWYYFINRFAAEIESDPDRKRQARKLGVDVGQLITNQLIAYEHLSGQSEYDQIREQYKEIQAQIDKVVDRLKPPPRKRS